MNPATVQDLTNNAGKVQFFYFSFYTDTSSMMINHSDFLDLPCEAEACCDKFAFMAIHISICLVLSSLNEVEYQWGKGVNVFVSLDIFAVHYCSCNGLGMVYE